MNGDPTSMEAAVERHGYDALLTPEQVAKRLNTSIDWVGSLFKKAAPAARHSYWQWAGGSGNSPLPASKIEEFIVEQERFAAPAQTRGVE